MRHDLLQPLREAAGRFDDLIEEGPQLRIVGPELFTGEDPWILQHRSGEVSHEALPVRHSSSYRRRGSAQSQKSQAQRIVASV